MSKRIRLGIPFGIALGLMAAACGSDDEEGSPAKTTEGGETTLTAGVVEGKITRSAAPAAGGVGRLFVAVFEADPVAAMGGDVALAQLLELGEVDMSAADASIEYSIGEITPRSEPYYVLAWLDDNGTVNLEDPASSKPDQGDLISMDGAAALQVKMETAQRVELDIVLNMPMPF